MTTHNKPENGDQGHLLGGLFDLRLNQYLALRLMPIFYTPLLIGAAFLVLAVVGIIFWLSPGYGVLALFAAPVAWLILAAIARAVLEFFTMAYRLMHTVEKMGQIAEHVSTLSEHIDLLQQRMEGITGNMQDIHKNFIDIRGDIRKVSGKVDTIYHVVELADPVLKPLVSAKRFIGGSRSRKA